MKRVGLFLVGFAAGWVVRSTVDSSRGLAVGAISALYGAAERVKRLVAIEREHLEDLVAEGRARYEAERDLPPRDSGADIAVARTPEIPRRGRAA